MVEVTHFRVFITRNTENREAIAEGNAQRTTEVEYGVSFFDDYQA